MAPHFPRSRVWSQNTTGHYVLCNYTPFLKRWFLLRLDSILWKQQLPVFASVSWCWSLWRDKFVVKYPAVTGTVVICYSGCFNEAKVLQWFYFTKPVCMKSCLLKNHNIRYSLCSHLVPSFCIRTAVMTAINRYGRRAASRYVFHLVPVSLGHNFVH